MSKYSAIRKKNKLSCKEFAKSLRDEFPVMGAAAVSLAERPHESGVQYTYEARKIIDERYLGLKGSESAKRKDNERIGVWVSEAVKSAFLTVQQAF